MAESSNTSSRLPLERPRENWGTRLGVILAVMGSAVGLGNFLRFPGLAARYEGGAFMIPYFLALLLLGLPLAWVEWAIGRYGGARGFNSAPGIYRAVWRSRIAPYFGVIAIIVPVVIYMYYVVIEAWCLGYAWYMATGKLDLGSDPKAYSGFFGQFVGAGENGFIFGVGTDISLVFVGICFLMNFVLIYRGLVKGIEWFNKWAMPLLILCALAVLVRVLTLPGTSSGLGFMWNPRTANVGFWEALSNGQMWLDASGQIFFSLSVGFGIIVNYASYVRKDDDIALSALTSAAGNEFCEVGLGGMITIPAAFIFLGAPAVLAAVTPPDGGTFNLGFITLPMVFDKMPLGRAVGSLFFFLLFIAAITSSVSMLQPAIALLEEGLGLARKASVTVLGFVTLTGAGFVLYFSKGLMALDTFDFWVGTFLIFVVATFQILLFGWVLGIERGYSAIQRGAEIVVPRAIMFIIKYISPLFLLAVFIMWGYQQVTATTGNYLSALRTSTVARMSVGFIILVGLFFGFIIAQSVRRWRKAESQGPGLEVTR